MQVVLLELRSPTSLRQNQSLLVCPGFGRFVYIYLQWISQLNETENVATNNIHISFSSKLSLNLIYVADG